LRDRRKDQRVQTEESKSMRVAEDYLILHKSVWRSFWVRLQQEQGVQGDCRFGEIGAIVNHQCVTRVVPKSTLDHVPQEVKVVAHEEKEVITKIVSKEPKAVVEASKGRLFDSMVIINIIIIE